MQGGGVAEATRNLLAPGVNSIGSIPMRTVALASSLASALLVLSFSLPSTSAQKPFLDDDHGATERTAVLRLEAAHAHCPLCVDKEEGHVVVPRLVRFTAFSSVSHDCNATLRFGRTESVVVTATDAVVVSVVVNGMRKKMLLSEVRDDGILAGWRLPVTLRAGVNTLGFYFDAPASVSCLEIDSAQDVHAADPGLRKAGTLPSQNFAAATSFATPATFVEYEAEDEAVARCVGSVLLCLRCKGMGGSVGFILWLSRKVSTMKNKQTK